LPNKGDYATRQQEVADQHSGGNVEIRDWDRDINERRVA